MRSRCGALLLGGRAVRFAFHLGGAMAAESEPENCAIGSRSEPCHAEAWPEPRAWPESKLSTVGCNDNCSSRERRERKLSLH